MSEPRAAARQLLKRLDAAHSSSLNSYDCEICLDVAERELRRVAEAAKEACVYRCVHHEDRRRVRMVDIDAILASDPEGQRGDSEGG